MIFEIIRLYLKFVIVILEEVAIQTQKAWIDSRHPMVNQRLWGLTLLERNIRELQKLGFHEVVVITNEGLNPVTHFCHGIPEAIDVKVEIIKDGSGVEHLCSYLEKEAGSVLTLTGHALNDRRLLSILRDAQSDYVLIAESGSNPVAAARLSHNSVSKLASTSTAGLTGFLSELLEHDCTPPLDLTTFDPYIDNLRREIPPFLLAIENDTELKEADMLLRETVHKGVLEFVAKYIHPPLEFGGVQLIAHTKITPNQITIFWLLLAALTIPLFMQGHLVIGLVLAAISGVLDGVDGKLARLTLRYSKVGDMLDHIGGTLYDAIWYLALGWYFSQGDPYSTAAQFTYVLVISYLFHRIVPGLFRKLHKHEIYDYGKIDIFMRLVGSRMNNNIWLLLAGAVLGYAEQAYFAICVWMLLTAGWYILRFFWVTAKSLVLNKNARLTGTS